MFFHGLSHGVNNHNLSFELIGDPSVMVHVLADEVYEDRIQR